MPPMRFRGGIGSLVSRLHRYGEPLALLRVPPNGVGREKQSRRTGYEWSRPVMPVVFLWCSNRLRLLVRCVD